MGVCCAIEASPIAMQPTDAAPPHRQQRQEEHDEARPVTPFANLVDSGDGSGDGRMIASSDTTLGRVAATATTTATTTTTTTSTTNHLQPPSSFPSSADLNEREDENSNETTVQRKQQMKDLKELPLSPVPLDRSPMSAMNPLALPQRTTPPPANVERDVMAEAAREEDAGGLLTQQSDNGRSSDDVAAQNSARRFTGSSTVAIVVNSFAQEEAE